MTWNPMPRMDVDLMTLPLDAQQGFLFSRLDGMTDVPTLASLTGMTEDQVALLLSKMVAMGAVAPTSEPLMDAGPLAPKVQPVPENEPEPESDPAASAQEITQRQLFETRLHAQPEDMRVAQARVAEEPELSAYCFDPVPKVIAAVLENPRTGGLQARLIATHHRSSAGLEALAARAAFTHDDGVRRALLRNPVLPVALFRRLWSPQRLLAQFLVSSSRECPEQTRAMARDLLRTSFNQRPGEERVELILTTEGRCLTALVGLTIDGQTTALLCRRTYHSTLLIQNIARWSAAPPQLIAHLRRQDAVRRNAVLRQMLERHPNAS
ncbi:MAG: hypothetical protein IPN59_07590 [Holophaga sp.]|nr:hypothetical protein [Holophaga sp.]